MKHACLDVKHFPPLAALDLGAWTWTCPACGGVTFFDVVAAELVPCSGPVHEDVLAGVMGCGDEIPG